MTNSDVSCVYDATSYSGADILSSNDTDTHPFEIRIESINLKWFVETL
jgi:hypothetical protein